jgi:PKHD-type hydroxylase
MSDTPAPAALPLQYRFPESIEISAQGVGSLAWRPGEGPFGQSMAQPFKPAVSAVHCLLHALSPQECEAVVAHGRSRPGMAGRVELGADSYRVSHIAWIERDPAIEWLFHRLGALFRQANQGYGFEMEGFVDALQFTEYGPGQHFEWHMDIGAEQTSLRKLSMTIQLTDGADYDGGDLEIVGSGTNPAGRARGAATFFPSYMAHRVTPVTRGVRRSLVAWGSGPAFR